MHFVLDAVRTSKGPKSGTVLTVHGPVTVLGKHRLPWYHRVDVRVAREATVRRWHMAGFVGVFNVFDKQNPSAIRYKTSSANNRVTVTRVPELLLGWLPSAGITVEF